jgi:hypothetical protein
MIPTCNASSPEEPSACLGARLSGPRYEGPKWTSKKCSGGGLHGTEHKAPGSGPGPTEVQELDMVAVLLSYMTLDLLRNHAFGGATLRLGSAYIHRMMLKLCVSDTITANIMLATPGACGLCRNCAVVEHYSVRLRESN